MTFLPGRVLGSCIIEQAAARSEVAPFVLGEKLPVRPGTQFQFNPF